MKTFRKSAASALAALLFLGPAADLPAYYEDAPAETAPSGRQADLDRINQTVGIPSVRKKLDEFGLTESEIARCLALLSDDELHEAAAHMEALDPSGDEDHALIAAVLVIGVLVPLYLNKPKPAI